MNANSSYSLKLSHRGLKQPRQPISLILPIYLHSLINHLLSYQTDIKCPFRHASKAPKNVVEHCTTHAAAPQMRRCNSGLRQAG
ncbi:hypothetical protein BJ165DRAFT_1479902 [Panaeolus papilionaceus]|nr:hypothetical protein BJ165DRAFT_1479902 [Panaeolus papilionaceus]